MNFSSNLNIFLLCIVYTNLYVIQSLEYDKYDQTSSTISPFDDDDYDEGDVNFRIIGGDDAKKIYPFLVSIQVEDKHYCGGSIITPIWILTAGHCTLIKKGRKYWRLNPKHCKAVAGLINLADIGKEAEIRKCKSLHTNPDYLPEGTQDDIGMISVTEPFTKKEINLAPTDIIDRTIQSFRNTKCNVIGWGSTHRFHKVTSKVLKEVELSLLSGAACSKHHRFGVISHTKHLCTLETGKDACQGDSGGPLICNGFLYGIISWGVGCATPDYPGVYTREDYYIDWIRGVINSSNKLTSNIHLILIIIPLYFINLFL